MKKKKFKLDIKNMGVNIDKNEYREIVLSDSNRPEILRTSKKISVKKIKKLNGN